MCFHISNLKLICKASMHCLSVGYKDHIYCRYSSSKLHNCMQVLKRMNRYVEGQFISAFVFRVSQVNSSNFTALQLILHSSFKYFIFSFNPLIFLALLFKPCCSQVRITPQYFSFSIKTNQNYEQSIVHLDVIMYRCSLKSII